LQKILNLFLLIKFTLFLIFHLLSI
jgi:hypothetical protein